MIRIPCSFHVLYSGSPPSLLRIPWGSGEVSVIQSRPYFRVYPLTAVPLNTCTVIFTILTLRVKPTALTAAHMTVSKIGHYLPPLPSPQGTLIRVHNTQTRTQMAEFRRGSDSANIYWYVHVHVL